MYVCLCARTQCSDDEGGREEAAAEGQRRGNKVRGHTKEQEKETERVKERERERGIGKGESATSRQEGRKAFETDYHNRAS